MDPNAAIASRLYAAARDALPAAPGDPRSGTDPAGRFAALAGDFAAELAAAESKVEAGLAGKADPAAVVQALAETELAIETAVTIRDKVVEAYQEILRMPV